ncbi:hypothetical protein RUM43_009541 [Polyplax serrata]|uniref:Protein Wnt n=1 Tax=Polyplax serrata TaxID=468196 RepID=A0AAN8RUH5_POLSC
MPSLSQEEEEEKEEKEVMSDGKDREGRSSFTSFKQELIGPTICKTFQGLNKDQMEVCQQFPDVTSSAMDGLQLAVDECQHQFQWHRWNCSSLSTKNKNPRSSVLLQRGKLPPREFTREKGPLIN